MPVDQERAARLREARGLAGYRTMADACRAFGWSEGTYACHENGSRGFANRVLIYANAYRIRRDWLLSGAGRPRDDRETKVKVVGTLGMRGIVENYDETGIIEEVEPPPGDNRQFVAYRVYGDGNYPALFDGDLVYAEEPRDPETCLGKQAVVTLSGGERRLCILSKSAAAGLFFLMSFNASPVDNAEVIEAAPVAWIKRG